MAGRSWQGLAEAGSGWQGLAGLDFDGFQWISMDLGRKSGGGFKGVKVSKGQNGFPSYLF